MIEALKTVFLVSAAVWAWCIVLWGWPGWPFEFVPHAQDATPALPGIPTNQDLAQILHHFEKIFSSWAQHANFTLIAGVGVVWIVAWMAIKLTKIHVESPRQIHYHGTGAWQGQELEQHTEPPLQLEPPSDEIRARLPVRKT